MHKLILLATIGLWLLPAALPAETQSTFVVGNSYSAQVRWSSQGYPALVSSAGHTDNVRKFTVPGAPLHLLWDNTNYVSDFRTKTWTNLSLQAWAGYDQELEHARNFAEAIWGIGPVGPNAGPGDDPGISPNCRVYIYAHGRSKNAAFDDGGFLMDRTAYSGDEMGTLDYFEDMANQLRSENPDKPVYVLPAAVVLYEIDKYMEAGLVPGFSDYADLLRDGGHTNDHGSYALALAFFATLFGEDPSGLPVPPAYTTDEATSAIFQEIAWRVVSRYPLSGVPQGLVVTTFAMPRALEDTAYSATLEAWGESGSVSWSLAEGSLPAGLTLNPDGSLTGTPQENGPFVFSVTTSDGSQSDTRQMLMFVDSNNPPVIETATLPAATVGTPYRVALEASGGVPGYTWSVKKDIIPHGLNLSPDGELTGVPSGEPGDIEVTFQVTDSNPGTPVTVEQSFILTTDPPTNGTWFLGLQDSPAPVITIDGALTEPAWDLQATANHPLLGEPDNSTQFGLIPTPTGLYIGITVQDDVVMTDSVDPVDDDGVQVFLDALHDREATFNADDRHIVITAAGAFEERNSRPTGIVHAVQTSGSGYSVEVFIPWSNLEITPADYFSIGFDLGISDDDDGGERDTYSAWLSATDLETAPSQLGNVCFWPILDENILLNPGFENGGQFETKGYQERFIVASDAGQGWRVTAAWLAPFMQRADAVGDGFPGFGSKAFGTNTGINGALFQLVNDARQTQGKGFLIFDVRDPDPALEFGVWGYNGGSSTVNTKLDAEVRQYPIDDGSPDAELLNGTLPATREGWVRYVYEFDAGPGYDYLLVGFALPTLTGSSVMRIDNITCGPAAVSDLLYSAPGTASVTLAPVRTTTTERASPLPLEIGLYRSDPGSPFGLGIVLTTSGSAGSLDFAEPLPDDRVIPARQVSDVIRLHPLMDGLPEGPENLTLQIAPSTRYSVGSPSSVLLTVQDHPVDQWLLDEFGGPLPDPDEDGDGAHWLLEYFSRTSPQNSSQVSLPSAAFPPGETRVFMDFTLRYDPLAAGVSGVLRASSNLQDWQDFPLTSAQLQVISETDHGDGTWTRTFRLPAIPGGEQSGYLQLKLQRH